MFGEDQARLRCNTFGVPASKPCDHFQCGEGTVLGFGDATSTFELTSVSGPITGTTNCFLLTAEETITLTSDGSTLRLEEPGTACLPGNSIQAPFPLPVDAEGTFSVRHGTGVFQGAKAAAPLTAQWPRETSNTAASAAH
jgi:hypothetical protein